mgnify:CR=1 FL=1
MSRIGKKPVELPSGVSASVSGQTIEVKGPKGTRSFKATDDVTLSVEDNVVSITPRGKSKRARQQWGMSRTMVANLVTGVTEGFKKELEIQGVGYRAAITGNTLKLNLGLSHDVDYVAPEGVTVTAPSSIFTSTCALTTKDNSPFEPFAMTFWPSRFAVTPSGIATGFLPMRDIVFSPVFNASGKAHDNIKCATRSEYLADHLTTQVLFASSMVRHHTFWC